MGHEKNHELRMQNETQSRMDNLVQSMGELAGVAKKLACEAAQQYSAEVENILKA
jgi:hypothetical protein